MNFSQLFRLSIRSPTNHFKLVVRNRRVQHLQPIKVLTDDGQEYDKVFGPQLDPIDEPIFTDSRDAQFQGSFAKMNEKVGKNFKRIIPQPKIEGIPQYEKLGEDNNEFVTTMMNAKNRKIRERQRLLILEGKRLISDAIKAGVQLKTIYFSLEKNLTDIENLEELVKKGVKLKKVFYKDIKLFSDHVTAPGVLGVFVRPNPGEHFNLEEVKRMPVTLVLDNIRDPGNLGAAIRVGAAAGVERILCTKGCVDIWESKVVRSSCGGNFRVPLVNDLEWDEIRNYMSGHLTSVYVADNKYMVDGTTSESHTHRRLQPLVYTRVNYFSKNPSVLLIVGGETIGLTPHALRFCKDFEGSHIQIPMEANVESLNSVMAASIIIYEIKRQFSKFSQ